MAHKNSKEYKLKVENALLDACKTDKEYEEADDSHLTRKKRDKLTAHVDNQIKKVKCDVAMQMSEENKRERGDIEGDFEELKPGEDGYEIQEELKEKRKESEALTKKMSKYKGSKNKFEHPVLKGRGLNEMQKKWIYYYCDPDSPYFNEKHQSYIAAGYTAKNKNSLMANISMNLKKPKIKDAIDAYRKSTISGKKLEISTEMVEILRRRATYTLDIFYSDDGEMIPYSEIPDEWKCCVDDRTVDYKGAQANKEIIKYKLCDRHKSIEALNKLLEVQSEISTVPKNPGGRPSSVSAAIDMGKDKDGNQGPRVVINMSMFEDD